MSAVVIFFCDDFQVLLYRFVALRRGNVIPGIGLYVILGNACACAIHGTQIGLRIGISLLGGQAIQSRRLGIVFWNAFAGGIHVTQTGLRRGIPCSAAALSESRSDAIVKRTAEIITTALSNSIPKYTDLIVILGLIFAMD